MDDHEARKPQVT